MCRCNALQSVKIQLNPKHVTHTTKPHVWVHTKTRIHIQARHTHYSLPVIHVLELLWIMNLKNTTFYSQIWDATKGSKTERATNSFWLSHLITDYFQRSAKWSRFDYFPFPLRTITLRKQSKKDKSALTQSYEMKQINSPQIHVSVKRGYAVLRRRYTYSGIITR